MPQRIIPAINKPRFRSLKYSTRSATPTASGSMTHRTAHASHQPVKAVNCSASPLKPRITAGKVKPIFRKNNAISRNASATARISKGQKRLQMKPQRSVRLASRSNPAVTRIAMPGMKSALSPGRSRIISGGSTKNAPTTNTSMGHSRSIPRRKVAKAPPGTSILQANPKTPRRISNNPMSIENNRRIVSSLT
ncbi:MAG: hypothetical protein BWY63_03828 [Chloroflexi bacterium ADurb.Bin360]|nr:MAG: hypothetical protein BWY63_03828 [Chloroflexi bacterium ADurb.Bin360]